MAVSSSQIQQLYIAYYGRPADPAGLAYWQAQAAANTAAGKTDAAILDLFGASFGANAEYTANFAGLSDVAKVNLVYNNLFSHDADPGGLLYWATKLTSGDLTIANIVRAVSTSAVTAANVDGTAFNSKVSAAGSFTASLATTVQILGYTGTTSGTAAKAWITSVNSAATLATAIAPHALAATVALVTTPAAVYEAANVVTATAALAAYNTAATAATTAANAATTANAAYDTAAASVSTLALANAAVTLAATSTAAAAAAKTAAAAQVTAAATLATAVAATTTTTDDAASSAATTAAATAATAAANAVTGAATDATAAAAAVVTATTEAANVVTATAALAAYDTAATAATTAANAATTANAAYDTAAASVSTLALANAAVTLAATSTAAAAAAKTAAAAQVTAAATLATAVAATTTTTDDAASSAATTAAATAATAAATAVTGAATDATAAAAAVVDYTAGTFTLTTGVNTFTGGAGADSFDASLISGAQTWQASDALAGGAGTDTITATLISSVTPLTMSGIENVNVTVTTAATLNLANATGVTNVNSVNSTATTTFSGITIAVTPAISDSASDHVLTYTGVSGSADAETVNLSAMTGGLSVAGIELLTLNAVNSGSTLTNITGSTATTLTATGDQALTITAVLPTTVNNVTASTKTAGALTVTMGAVATATLVGGAGADSFNINAVTGNVNASGGAGNDTFIAATNLTITDTIAGGADTDTLLAPFASVSTAGYLTPTTRTITGIETLVVTDDVAGALTAVGVDTGITTVSMAATTNTASAVTFNAGASTLNIGLSATTAGTAATTTAVIATSLAVVGATTDGDNITIRNNNSSAGTANAFAGVAIAATGTETLTINTGSYTTAVAQTSGTVGVTGSTGFTTAETLVITGANRYTPGVVTADIINASAMTFASTAGNPTYDGTAGTTAQTVTGSAGNDILIVATTSNVSVNGGAGNDTIQGGAGNDTLIGDEGNDSITSGAGNDSISGGAGNDTITMAGSLTAADTIDGGTGTNTLSVTTFTDAAIFANVTNIQALKLTGATTAVSAPISLVNTFDLSDATASQSLTLATGYTGATTITETGNTAAFADTVINAANVALTVNGAMTDVTAMVLTGGTSTDVMNIKADGTTGNMTNVTGVETITILANATTPASTAVLQNLAAATGKSVAVNASGLTAAGATFGLNAVSGAGSFVVTAATAGGTIDLSVGTGDATVTGGAGIDTITLSAGIDSINGGAENDAIIAGTTLTNTDVIDGGAGVADTLTATISGTTATTGAFNISNVETVTFALTGASVVNATGITGATTAIAFTGASGLTLTGLSAAPTVNFGSAGTAFTGTSNIALTTATGSSDSLTVRLNTTVAQTAGALTTAGIETLNITQGAVAAGTQTLDLSLSTAATVNVTATAANSNGQTLALGTLNAAATTVDASGNLGLGTFSVTGSNTVGMSIKGSAGNNNITGGSNADTITISVFDGADTVNGGAGIDTLIATNTATAITSLANISNVETMSLAVGTAAAASTITTVGALDGASLKSFTLTGGTAPGGTTAFKVTTAIASAGTNLLTSFDASGYAGALDIRIDGVNTTDNLLTTGNTLKGGTATTDVARVSIAGVTLTNPTISGFERFEINSTGASTLNFTNTTGLTNVVITGTEGTTIAGLAAGVAVDLGQVTVAGSGELALTAADAKTYTIGLASASGTSDSLTVNMRDVSATTTGTTIAADGVESITIVESAVTGKNFKVLVTDVNTVNPVTLTFTGGAVASKMSLPSGAVQANVTVIDSASGSSQLLMESGARVGTTVMTITGGAGNDSLIMKHASDSMTGGAGTDTLSISTTHLFGGVQIDLNSTTDQITMYNGSANAVVQTGFENVDLSGLTTSFSADITAKSTGSSITGTANADQITGGAGADTIIAGSGNDVITGGAGANIYNYSTAALFEGRSETSGKSTYAGGADTDTLLVAAASVSGIDADLAGLTSVEVLTLTGASTVVLGTNAAAAGFTTVNAGAGATNITATVLVGLTINAALIPDATALAVAGATTNHTITGLIGDLTVNDNASGNVAVTTGSVATVSVILGTETTGTHTVTATALTDTQTLTLTGSDITAVTLTLGDLDAATMAGALTVTATDAGSNIITTGTGVDSVLGGAGNDIIKGGDGADTLLGEAGDDFIQLDSAAADNDVDSINGGIGSDTYLFNDDGEADVFTETAEAGQIDTLWVTGNLSAATIKVNNATAGLALGGAGGLGFEQIVIDNATGTTFTGAQLSGLTINVLEAVAVDSNLIVTGTATGTTDLSFLTFNAGNYLSTAGAVTAGVVRTNGTDTIKLNATDNTAHTLVGTIHADSITGGAAIDNITGGLGADTITGGQGADIMDGGDGDDSIVFVATAHLFANGTAALTSSITGGNGTDTITVGSATTAFAIAAGNSWARSNTIEKIVSVVNTGATSLNLAATAETAGIRTVDISLASHASSNLVSVASYLTGGVTITTGVGATTVVGGGGGDIITGGVGIDSIYGGAGADTMTGGGTGANSFGFVLGNTGTPSATNFDTITDFSAVATNLIGVYASVSAVGVLGTQTTIVLGSASTAAAGMAGLGAGNGAKATFHVSDTTFVQRLAAVENALSGNTNTVAEAAYWTDGQDSYLFIADGSTGIGPNDILIKLTGITGGNTAFDVLTLGGVGTVELTLA